MIFLYVLDVVVGRGRKDGIFKIVSRFFGLVWTHLAVLLTFSAMNSLAPDIPNTLSSVYICLWMIAACLLSVRGAEIVLYRPTSVLLPVILHHDQDNIRARMIT